MEECSVYVSSYTVQRGTTFLVNKETNRRDQSQRILRVRTSQSHQTDLASIFSLLEENVMTFVKNELKMFKRILSPELPEGFESQTQDMEVVN
ncbi:hypothetical protein J4Q44_G00389970, partial [Coregonus suidteri]